MGMMSFRGLVGCITSNLRRFSGFTARLDESRPETFVSVIGRVTCPGCRAAQLTDKPGDPKIDGARVRVESGGALGIGMMKL